MTLVIIQYRGFLFQVIPYLSCRCPRRFFRKHKTPKTMLKIKATTIAAIKQLKLFLNVNDILSQYMVFIVFYYVSVVSLVQQPEASVSQHTIYER